MTISLADVRIEFENLNTKFDNAVSQWSELQQPIPNNYCLTRRMFALNPEYKWVECAYWEWENANDAELSRIAKRYGFTYDVNSGALRSSDLGNLIEKALGELKLYYNYDLSGGNRSLDDVLEKIATVKFSLTRDNSHEDEVLKFALNLCNNAVTSIKNVFRIDDMIHAYVECKGVLEQNVIRCATHMRPLYQHDYEFIMSEVVSFEKYDWSADLVRKIMEITRNGDFDSWYDSTVESRGSLSVLHDLEVEMHQLATDLDITDWWI